MKFNTTSLKRCIGSLAFMSACTVIPQAFAEEETYTCQVAVPQQNGAPQWSTVDVKASSVEDAKAKALNYPMKPYIVLEVKECNLKQ